MLRRLFSAGQEQGGRRPLRHQHRTGGWDMHNTNRAALRVKNLRPLDTIPAPSSPTSTGAACWRAPSWEIMGRRRHLDLIQDPGLRYF
jgi:hypothetical protein